MSAVNNTVQTFSPPSVNQTNRASQLSGGLSVTATLVSGKSFKQDIDANSTGIRIDNETLSTFPIPKAGANAISELIKGAVSTTPNVSPVISQSTSPNPKAEALMSPTPDILSGLNRMYA